MGCVMTKGAELGRVGRNGEEEESEITGMHGRRRPWRPRRSGATQWCRCVRPRLRVPAGGGGLGGNPSGTVTRVAAGRLREPAVCGEILGDVVGSAPLLPQKFARHVWRSTRCGSCPLLSPGGLSPHGPSETRQRRCFSRSVARLLCNLALLTALFCRLCLPLPSTDRLAFAAVVCFGTGTPCACLPPAAVCEPGCPAPSSGGSTPRQEVALGLDKPQPSAGGGFGVGQTSALSRRWLRGWTNPNPRQEVALAALGPTQMSRQYPEMKGISYSAHLQIPFAPSFGIMLQHSKDNFSL
ncbi:uncharacterized protein LOC128784887 [Vidua chalybeata]|uniref:uncharacterized protein LOC128784887 n=1 Tax=Vidua chalybeata TaxID=81927 RepID=UPI0023A839F2|nr:uncharacterized protein LOC128784887 [Vidua chalybeata]